MPRVRRAEALFGEKEFYLEEFRGRSVFIAVAPETAAARVDLGPLAAAVTALVRNDTRVLLWWPAVGRPAERRMLTALRPARRARHASAPVLRLDATAIGGAAGETLRGRVWTALRRGRLCVLVARGGGFPRPAVSLAVQLGIPKLVLLDPRGGLLGDARNRLSFVDENLLETLLRQGEAEWSGLGERRPLLMAVRDALLAGVAAVNVCAPQRIGEELFSYAGSGTLFTPSDYCHIAPLALDDLDQAERLLQRSQREGLLKRRSPEEMAQALSVSFGATLDPGHLAGVAGLLTAPYTAERAGEIVALATITRFKGEGIGERLVTRLLAEAESAGLDYVFACAIHERAKEFFARIGFERVAPRDVPAAKWVGYDPRRRARLAVFRRRLAARASAAEA